MYPFPVVQILDPYHTKFLLVLCVSEEGGYSEVFGVFFMLFFISELHVKPKSFSYQTYENSYLIFSKIRKDVAKFVVCCSQDWRFKD